MGLFSSNDFREYVPQPKETLTNLRAKHYSEEEGYEPAERIELAVLKLLDETTKIRHMVTFFYILAILGLICSTVYVLSAVF